MSQAIQELLEQGRQMRVQHRHAEAKAIYAQALSQASEEAEPAQMVQALTRYGGIERDLGNIDSALQHYRQALELCRALDTPLTLAHTIRHVADILRESGQLDAAQPCYWEALAIYRTHPETGTLDLANTLRGLALLEANRNHREEAIALWQEAGSLYDRVWRQPGSPFSQADLAPGIAESARQVAQLSSR
jgi:tetratricopeptide (TPR) repeat protein